MSKVTVSQRLNGVIRALSAEAENPRPFEHSAETMEHYAEMVDTICEQAAREEAALAQYAELVGHIQRQAAREEDAAEEAARGGDV